MTGVAAGNISPSRFLVRATTADAKFSEATSVSVAIAGISQPGTRNTPYGSLDDGYAAVAGENLHVYMPPDREAPLELAGTVAAGDLLTCNSGSDGRGVAASAGNQIGARALMAGVSGQIITVQPLWGPKD